MTTRWNALGGGRVVRPSEQSAARDRTRRISVPRFGGDVEDGATLKSAMGDPGVHITVHLAKGIASAESAPMRCPQIDIRGSACVSEAARPPEVKRVLYTGTTCVDTRFDAHPGPAVWEPITEDDPNMQVLRGRKKADGFVGKVDVAGRIVGAALSPNTSQQWWREIRRGNGLLTTLSEIANAVRQRLPGIAVVTGQNCGHFEREAPVRPRLLHPKSNQSK
jgi:hypothetical protein